MKLYLKIMHKQRLLKANGLKEAEVDLTNNYNLDYIGTFYVGNPPQPLRGVFDTGSANAWILSIDC